LHRLKN